MSQDNSTISNNSNVSSVTSRELHPTRRNNACPVCENISGKCRTRGGSKLVLCGNNHNSLQGWDYLGDSSNPLWGKFLPSGETPDPEARAEVPPPREIMPAQEKHERWLEWINTMELYDHELQELTRRNLSSEEIDYITSIARSQMYRDKDSARSYPSIVIPFMDVNGQFTGAQRRICGDIEGGRYRWAYLKGQENLNNEFLEKPLAVWPAEDKRVCWLVEGTGIKPMIASKRFDRYVVGAVGGLHYTSPQTLKESIPDGAKVLLVLDAGDAVNEHVVRRIVNNMHFLDSDYSAQILWWDQVTKDDSDIDEIENLDSARTIGMDEFLEFVPDDIKEKLQLNRGEENVKTGTDDPATQTNKSDPVTADAPAVTACDPFPARASAISDPVTTPRHFSVLTDNELKKFEKSLELDPIFDPFDYLPEELARVLVEDAETKNIDPVCIWQYLAPGVASLMGKNTYLDFPGFKCVNILWTLLVQPSGYGKSRAMNLVGKWFNDCERVEYERYQLAELKYEADLACFKKNKDKDSVAPEDIPRAPKRRKYVFNIATPQSVTKKLGDQMNNGVVWLRDELKGIFSSLNQFTSAGEGLEILLETYEGEGAPVDRVDEQNSYMVSSSRLSIGGGIQPDVVAQTFSLEDTQGVLARFCIAVPRILPVKRINRYCKFSDEVSGGEGLFNSTEKIPFNRIQPTEEADQFFTKIVEEFGNQKTFSKSEDAWTKKLAGKAGRLALVLHAIECHYYLKDPYYLTLDTLQRAYKLALYYKACYKKMSESLDMTGEKMPKILQQICSRIEVHGPQSAADLYRAIKPLRTQAREEGVKVGDFTKGLLSDLEQRGFLERDGSKYKRCL